MMINFEKFAAMVAKKGELSLSFSMMNDKLVVKAAVKAPSDKKLSDEEEKSLSPIALTGTVAEFQEKFAEVLTDYLTLGKELVELPDPVKTFASKKKDLKSAIEKRKTETAKKDDAKVGDKGGKSVVAAKPAQPAPNAQPALFDLADMNTQEGSAPAQAGCVAEPCEAPEEGAEDEDGGEKDPAQAAA